MRLRRSTADNTLSVSRIRSRSVRYSPLWATIMALNFYCVSGVIDLTRILSSGWTMERM